MREETAGQCGVAIDQRTVDLEGAPSPAETVAQQFVVTHPEALRGHVPEGRQRSFDTFGQQHPELPLETQHVPRHPLGIVAAGNVLQQAIDEAGKGLHAVAVGSAVD